MTFKATAYDTNTSDGSPLEIIPKQILLKDGVPYAIFSQNGMRYEDFELEITTPANIKQ